MDTLHILILALAVYRTSSLLAVEHGPYNMFDWVREKCGVQYTKDDYGEEIAVTDSELAKMISCPFCNSVWLGAIASLLYITLGIAVVWLALPLALSAFAVIASSLVDR